MKALLPRAVRRLTFGAIILTCSLIGVASVNGQDATAQNKTTPAGVISGKVVTRDGEALSNARVSVGRIGSGVMTPQSVRVDRNGTFQTQPLEPGLYWVSAYVAGFIVDTSQPPTAPAMYRPGDTATIALSRGAVITGTVKNSNGDGVVAIPVRAIRIRSQNGKPVQFSGSARETLTDDRGIYRLYGLSAGAYLISAGGPSRPSGVYIPTAYETLVPTYAPSATRDMAMEIPVNNGDEVTVDVQFREETGHAVSGLVAGAAKSEAAINWAVGVSLFDLRNHAEVATTTAISTNNFAFALYGVPDGDYELYASQGSPTGDQVASEPKQIRVQSSDVTGIALTLAPLAGINGRIVLENDPKAACGKRRTSALLESSVYVRRYEPERQPAKAQSKDSLQIEVPFVYRNSVRQAVVDGRGNFEFKALRPGNYRIDPREPASGWYVKSVTIGPTARPVSIVRDGVTVKSGEGVSGLTVTIAEGAAQFLGKVSLAEGQSLSPSIRVYLVPSERENAENVLRFYEARPDANRSFTIDYINPGKYLIVARPVEENEYGVAKSIRHDPAFRATVLRDAEPLKKEIVFKPCEQTFAYELSLNSPTSPP